MTLGAGTGMALLGTAALFLDFNLLHIVLGAVLGIVVLIAFFIGLALIAGLCERQRLTGDMDPAREPFPYRAPPYWRATREDALRLGLHHAGDFASNKKASLIKGLQSLYLTQDRQVIVSVESSSFLFLKVRKTVLRTRLVTGRILESSDQTGTDDFSGVIDKSVLLNAGLAELLPFHVQRVVNAGSTALPFHVETALEEYQKMDLERAARWVLLGRARWADPQHTSIRLTFRGAWGHVAQVPGGTAKLQNQVHRTYIRRAGSRVGD